MSERVTQEEKDAIAGEFGGGVGRVIVPLDALQEVIRISDREHPAWDAVKAAIAASQGDQA